MIEANNKINSLSNDINNMGGHISASVNQQTAIQNYNAEREIAEIQYMNKMNQIFNWR